MKRLNALNRICFSSYICSIIKPKSIMKKVIYIMALAVITACTTKTETPIVESEPVTKTQPIVEEVDRCVTFTPEDAQQLNERMDSTLFTESENILIGDYMLRYIMVNPVGEDANNPIAQHMAENFKKEGFVQLSDVCEVLDHQREQIATQGMTEEEYVNNLKGDFEGLNKGLDEVSETITEGLGK